VAALDGKIAIIGGSGAEGTGLALRFAKAGLTVLIGSRDADRAEAAAAQISMKARSTNVSGHRNEQAADSADVVVLTVPLAAHAQTLKSLNPRLKPGTIVVDATVPLEIAIGGRVSRVLSLWDGSAAQQCARLVPEGVRVVAAFHSLSAGALARLEERVDCDVLVCGDDDQAKRAVAELAGKIDGVRAIDAGPLESARYLETSAALLISLNLQHKVKHSGMRITGLPERSGPR